MPEDGGPDEGLRYDVMVETALRGVVREALSYVAENGLPDDHHFYVTFRTECPGVVIPDRLMARYPREMTIVLQYQFWDLQVGDDAFAVTLSFNNAAERLTVPFEAVVAFADPSVRFGLQFETSEEDEETEGGAVGTGEQPVPGGKEGRKSAVDDAGEAGGGNDSGDKVVTLDKFRKKQ